MQDMLNARKRGDVAFREKDFKTAIKCYTEVQCTNICILHVFVLTGFLLSILHDLCQFVDSRQCIWRLYFEIMTVGFSVSLWM